MFKYHELALYKHSFCPAASCHSRSYIVSNGAHQPTHHLYGRGIHAQQVIFPGLARRLHPNRQPTERNCIGPNSTIKPRPRRPCGTWSQQSYDRNGEPTIARSRSWIGDIIQEPKELRSKPLDIFCHCQQLYLFRKKRGMVDKAAAEVDFRNKSGIEGRDSRV